MAGRGQLDAPGHILARVGTGQDGERQLEVLGATGDRALPPMTPTELGSGGKGNCPLLGRRVSLGRWP